MIRFAKTKRNVNKLSMLTSLYFQRVLAIIIFLCGQKQFFTTFLLPTSFINFFRKLFIIPLFYAFFPQHCLYFFPLPHVVDFPILSILLVFIVLSVFSLILVQSNIRIISIIGIIFTINILSTVDKLRTLSTFVH